MSGPVEYLAVSGTVARVRELSILFVAGNGRGLGAWVPRSQIHPEDRAMLDGCMAGEERLVRIAARKAIELGLAGRRDSATGDLFGGR